MVYETATNQFGVWLDLTGTGEWRPLDVTKPVYWPIPITGGRIEFRFTGLVAARSAFLAPDWTDDRIPAEVATRNAALRRAARVYEGTWYEEGDATRSLTIRFDPDAPYPVEARFSPNRLGSLAALSDLTVGADGHLRGFRFLNAEPVLVADGSRVDFPAANTFWTRKPVTK